MERDRERSTVLPEDAHTDTNTEDINTLFKKLHQVVAQYRVSL